MLSEEKKPAHFTKLLKLDSKIIAICHTRLLDDDEDSIYISFVWFLDIFTLANEFLHETNFFFPLFTVVVIVFK